MTMKGQTRVWPFSLCGGSMADNKTRLVRPLLPVGIGAGIAIGVAIGMAMGNVGAGIAIGVALGVAFAAGSRRAGAGNDTDQDGKK
ncbi:MAG: hypothetical protein QM795_04010 [Pseudoxanthomonas sp.]